MSYVALASIFKPALQNLMIQPKVENNALELLGKRFSHDPVFISQPVKDFGAIAFGRAVNLREVTNTDALITSRNIREEDPVTLHNGAVEIRFLYIEQTTDKKTAAGGLQTERAVLELKDPMIFNLDASGNGLTMRYEYKHMVSAGAIPGVEGSKPVQVEQTVTFEGTVVGDRIIVTFDKKPYGINPLGYFAKVHRTVK